MKPGGSELKHFFKYQFPAVLWAALIFGFSSIEKIPTIKFIISTDKLGHVVVFFVLSFLCWRAFNNQESIQWLKTRAILSGFMTATLYGLFDEIHQRFVPGRYYDLYDFLADSLGALLFVFVHAIYQKHKSLSKSPS